MTEEDIIIVATMEKYGGSFVRALAALARRADPVNLRKIKNTWSQYWEDYEALAKTREQ